MTSIANTYNLTNQKPHLLYKLFCRDLFYYICCVSCFAVTSFSIFSVLVVLPWHLLSYSLYQLFCHGILYYICCISCSAVASFIIFWSSVAPLIIFVVSVVLLCQQFLPLHFLLLWLAHLTTVQLAAFCASLFTPLEHSACTQTSS